MKKHVWEIYILSILHVAVLFQFSVTLTDTGMVHVVDSLDTDH